MSKKKQKDNEIRETEKKSSGFLNIFFIVIVVALGVIFYLNFRANQFSHNKIINHSLVKEGSGLYADTIETGLNPKEPFSSKYYFRGKDVNNYLLLDGKCFRIINITQKNALKIMYIGDSNNNTCDNIEEKPLMVKWDENGNNEWETSTIKKQLENWAEQNNLKNSPYVIQNATWFIGGVQFFEGGSLTDDIKNERSSNSNEKTTYVGVVGLINTSDYLKANDKPCFEGTFKDIGQCGENNYLNNEKSFWTMNKTYNDVERVWAVERTLIEIDDKEVETTLLQSKYVTNNKFEAYPVVYLKENLILKGKGSTQQPYYIIGDYEK